MKRKAAGVCNSDQFSQSIQSRALEKRFWKIQKAVIDGSAAKLHIKLQSLIKPEEAGILWT